MALHDRMKKLIDRMTSTNKYGTENVTIKIHTGTYDPSTGSYDSEDEEENTYDIKAIACNYSDYLISKDTIEQSDIYVTVALFDVDPTIGSIITIREVDYQVLNVRRIDVQGVVIGWQLQLRV